MWPQEEGGRRKHRMGPGPVTCLLLAIVAGGVAVFLLMNGGDAKGSISTGARTVPVVKGVIERTVMAVGNIQPRLYVDVGSQISGQLKQVYVLPGDIVAPGQLLAEIEPTVFKARVAASEAQVDSLSAQLVQAAAQLELDELRETRGIELHASSSLSRDTLDARIAAVKVGRAKVDALTAQIRQTQAALDADRANLGFTKIYAPIAGTVVDQFAKTGQTINAAQTTPIICRIADLDSMSLTAEIAEGEIPKVRVGMALYFVIPGIQGRRWEGTIRQILPTPRIVNDVVLYNVTADVPNGDRQLMIGMTAQVFLVVETLNDVLSLPLSAFQSRVKYNGVYEVVLKTAQGHAKRSVRVGVSDRRHVQVLDGLEVGDLVVLPEMPHTRHER